MIAGQVTELQLDEKAMPGESGPCFMISQDGCFKGYLARRKDGSLQAIGTAHYSLVDLQVIGEHLNNNALISLRGRL